MLTITTYEWIKIYTRRLTIFIKNNACSQCHMAHKNSLWSMSVLTPTTQGQVQWDFVVYLLFHLSTKASHLQWKHAAVLGRQGQEKILWVMNTYWKVLVTVHPKELGKVNMNYCLRQTFTLFLDLLGRMIWMSFDSVCTLSVLYSWWQIRASAREGKKTHFLLSDIALKVLSGMPDNSSFLIEWTWSYVMRWWLTVISHKKLLLFVRHHAS